MRLDRACAAVGLPLAVLLAFLVPGPAAAAEDPIFDLTTILPLRIEVSAEALQQLRALQSWQSQREYVRATVWEGQTAYRDVGLRPKGSIGSFRGIDSKPGLTLKFNQFIPTQRFHGLKKLHLNNSVQDSSHLCEALGGELFRAAGVPAPRVGFARVELNQRKLGLYVVSEAVTRDFLARWFQDTKGNLYEGPGEVNSENLDLDSKSGGSDRLDRADVQELAAAAREPDLRKRMERLEKLLDMDRFISFLAMEAVTCHWDGYTTGRNNYHLYHDPVSDKMVFIPHGLDQLFQNINASIFPPARGLVAQAVLKTAAGRRRYRERLTEIVEKIFNPEALQKRIDEVEAKLRTALRADGFGTQFSHNAAVKSLTWRIAERGNSLRQQLEGSLVISAGPALAFNAEGRARLSAWQPRVMTGGNPEFSRPESEGEQGGPALKVTLDGGAECRASWRQMVFLTPGRYLFTARIRTAGVEPMAGKATDGGKSGADVRISGDQPKVKLLGTRDWTTSNFEFEIESEEGVKGPQPTTQVELVCELQASAGEVWFDERSIELRRLPPRATAASAAPESPEAGAPAAAGGGIGAGR